MMNGLETVYDSLAEAIDKAGEQNAMLFLVKLALLNARQIGNAELFQQHIEQALLDVA
jgi:hypothetical protein